MNQVNVILITIDCLRADHTGFMGYGRRITPVLDRLAAESYVFDRAFATGPRTADSFPGILASRYSLMYGGGYALAECETTLAESLSDNGYDTGGFHSNPHLSTSYGYDRGFTTFWDSMDNVGPTSRMGHVVNRRLQKSTALSRLIRRVGRFVQTRSQSEPYARAEVINNQAIRWLQERQKDSPFFLWLHYMDAHYPYLPPEEHLRRVRSEPVSRSLRQRLLTKMIEDPGSITPDGRQILIDLYDGEVSYIDNSVGNLLATIGASGDLDNALILVTADHGEEFGEHGEYSHATWASEVRSGRVIPKLHDELIHVPLLVRLPGAQLAGTRVDSLVSLLDLGPTILDVLGLDVPAEWVGESLLATTDGAEPVRETIFSEHLVHNQGFRGPVVACRSAGWKYIYDGVFDQHELYDLERDPKEQANLISEHVDQAAAMAEVLSRHLALIEGTAMAATEVVKDRELQDRLRALGYVE